MLKLSKNQSHLNNSHHTDLMITLIFLNPLLGIVKDNVGHPGLKLSCGFTITSKKIALSASIVFCTKINFWKNLIRIQNIFQLVLKIKRKQHANALKVTKIPNVTKQH